MKKIVAIIVKNCDYNDKIYGLTLVEWLIKPLKEIPYLIVEDVHEAKEYIQKSEYALVLFSSYPVMQENKIQEIINYATTKELDFCDFIGGYVIKSNYFQERSKNILSSTYNIENRIEVKDSFSLNKVKQQLRLLIINKHINNNVEFENSDNCIIDATVHISSDVKIGNNCVIRGNTSINPNGQILQNSYLNNVTVGNNVTIIASYLEDCIIEKDTVIGPYTRIRKGTVIKKMQNWQFCRVKTSKNSKKH